ncbi:efflux RND transporter permease subunit [Litchfieldia salsa]|uniref:Hydrophobic/amphiphilic exporter-1, HAE1 family n=1 Tax=Litchfieldia salsa TaxID=930152 RepID=A0A1H0U1V1_9BACI|nr:efflux RND transporter permease subunit [Litchfieldia salsa]SDP60282.1 hydrophobic/amphiphilic exporter-1, HAE1 family [Litchfieldia salsa]
MSLIRFIVQRKILVGLMVVLVVFVGSFAMMRLDKELFPGLEFDGAYVEIDAGDMQAVEVERTITTPLEQSIQAMDGIESINSTTYIGSTSIQVAFERGRGEELFKELESIVNTSTADMSGIKDVLAGRVGMNASYEFFMDVTGEDMDQITSFAKNTLEPRLEELPEVRDVSLGGIQEYEISIAFDREKVVENGLDVTQVIGLIQQSNTEATLGELSGENDSPTIRWNTKLEEIEQVKAIKVPTQTGFIALDEVANVTLEPVESSSFVWKNGSKDFIFVQIGRVSDVTQIEMAAAIREELKNIKDEGLVEGFELNEMVAQADYVQESIDGVASNILIGGIIAVIILLLFLRNVRATLIVGLSIPTSVLLTFAMMWLFDYSFNILTLVGLGLGIGMMVDSSIVILESIYRKKEQGLKSLEAVVEGTREVATAVISSMLTTIVVFLPIGLIGGEMGQFMIILSMVVAITLISSVIVSFTVIPSLSEKFLRFKAPKKQKEDGRLMRVYSKVVGWTVKKKRYSLAIVAAFFIMFAGSLALITKIPMSIMPDVFNRYNEILLDVESGLSLEDKEKLVQDINSTLSSIEDVESSYVMDNGSMLYTIVNMTKGDDITREQKEINEEIMSSLRELAETTPIENVASAMTGGGGSPVQVNIKGESFEELTVIADDFITELEEIDGIVGVKNTIERTSIEQVIELKTEAIEDAGLTDMQLKQYIEQSFLQMPVGEVASEEETLPLIVKWDGAVKTQSDLLDVEIPTKSGMQELSTFISLKNTNTPNEITHTDGERFISISADIEDKDLGSINREVQKLIEEFESPAGYSVAVAGDLEQQQELMQEMIFVLAIAIFLVYLVMAVQFNHLIHPIVVMSVIPMTIVGVILGLFLTQRELSIMSGMGIVMLIGIVLNNAILLIDRTNQLRREGFSIEDALVEAGINRIRPIFMTTLTTVGGMLPLALATGTSGNYQAPMATVIISGLLFATFITLLLIPAVYRLLSSSGKKKGQKKKKEDELEQTEAAS